MTTDIVGLMIVGGAAVKVIIDPIGHAEYHFASTWTFDSVEIITSSGKVEITLRDAKEE